MTFNEELTALMKKYGVKEVHVKPVESFDIQVGSNTPLPSPHDEPKLEPKKETPFTNAVSAAEATIAALKSRAGITTHEA